MNKASVTAMPLLMVAAATFISAASVEGSETVEFRERRAVVRVHMTAEPQIGQWEVDGKAASDKPISSSGGYEFALTRQGIRGHAVWTASLSRQDGQSFRISEYAYECRIPRGEVVAVFDTQVPDGPSIFRQAPQIEVAIDVRPNAGVPFMMACDHYGNNTLAVGPMDQTGTYRISGRLDGEDYVMLIERREYEGDWYEGKLLQDALFISTEPAFWFDTARSYADLVDEQSGYKPRPIPEGADLPYYSTWYAFGDKIDSDVVWENAVLAKEMGVGNFLIFIGWSECENWFSSENAWGDYTPCSSRFKDFGGLVDRMQKELDMNVQVWVAPTWVGAKSKAFEEMKPYRSKWPEGDYDRNLDPRSPEARDHIRKRFAELARQQGVDGFYLDFLDTLFNRNDAPHEKQPRHFGTAYAAFLEAIYEGFASVDPEPMAEYRMPFANLLSKHYASMFNTTYSEKSWDRNRMLAIMLQPFARGVLCRCDPLLLTTEQLENRDTVGKILSAIMMCGPPGISMDLTEMEAGRREHLRRWFEFYKQHRDDLIDGEFRPFGREYHYPEMMISRGDTSYAWVSRWETDEVPFPVGTRHAFIFTALPTDVSFIARLDITHVTGLVPGRYRARWYDSSLESHQGDFEITIKSRPPPRVRTVGRARENWDFAPDEERPSLDVRRGGMLELEWIDSNGRS